MTLIAQERPQDTHNKQTEKYYSKAQWMYNLGWNWNNTHSIHYGIWYYDTKNIAEAIDNTNRLIQIGLELKSTDIVLDAGCGVGGTSVYLAKHFGCEIHGISISGKQVNQATELAEKYKVINTNFSKRDFTNTRFSDETFTKIFGIESLSYAINKKQLWDELYRILKPQGKIAIIDGWLGRNCYDKKEEKSYTEFLRGWNLSTFLHLDEYIEILENAGFTNIKFINHTTEIERTAKLIWRLHVPFYPFIWALSKLRIVSKELLWHWKTSINQKNLKVGDDPLITYGIMTADKP